MSALSNITDNFQSSLAQVRQRFCESLGSKVDQLDALMWTLEENPSDVRAIEMATNTVHKLAGIAPNFGLNEVGELAASAEKTLMEFAQQPCAERFASVADAVERLTDRLDQIQVD